MPSSSVTSVIRSFAVVLSAVSYVAAQVPLGVEMVPNPEMPSYNDQPYPSNSDLTSTATLPAETGSPAYGAPPSQYTPPPANTPKYEPIPYSSFVDGGYSQMDCGYGYKKGYDGKCTPESWWGDNNSWGCYQTTVIINNGNPHQYCPPPSTVTVTDKSVETKILTVTYTQPIPTTIVKTDTLTDIKTETLYVTKTETLPITITTTDLLVESKTLTETNTIKETLTDVITKTDIKVLPTTFTTVWIKTDIIDKTNTIERTLTSTVVDKKTLTDTVTYLSTKIDVSTQFSVATSTTTQIVMETGLADCLSQCDQYKYLKPGNSNQWNTYASPPAHTPSPTSQPYQYQHQGGGSY